MNIMRLLKRMFVDIFERIDVVKQFLETAKNNVTGNVEGMGKWVNGSMSK